MVKSEREQEKINWQEKTHTVDLGMENLWDFPSLLTLTSPMSRKGVKRKYMRNTATSTLLRKITEATKSV